MEKKFNGWNDNKSSSSGVGGKPGPFEERPANQPEEKKSEVVELNKLKLVIKNNSYDCLDWYQCEMLAHKVLDYLASSNPLEGDQEKEIVELKRSVLAGLKIEGEQIKEIERLKELIEDQFYRRHMEANVSAEDISKAWERYLFDNNL